MTCRTGQEIRAQFTGAVPADRVAAELARMSVGIACHGQDQLFYFSPLKLNEYMAAGLPAVVLWTGGAEGSDRRRPVSGRMPRRKIPVPLPPHWPGLLPILPAA
ncbi:MULTISPECIES: hypothetical protein [unclassified Paracoccus (in: a-proteobacteria)]|uniref:hypothetical protein n=1 Tax=unclassified Paracoccus (in: a-proteobacteria) TaxID=2688777 RepID=UPI001600F659|nr:MULTISPECIES: hypothetical protein [unclassified Paracoccus (in: a-proteobacteria)]MBB1490151.1 hypothetical protein [Paracoccus sp. MC1854]MBB1496738.1 hypothetical protein [Paracoccus sp. MC1862]